MTEVTFQLVEGLERGRVYSSLPTPVTIGREDENAIRLNDERVSRFHAKVQTDGGRVILTDLDSTNGTRVNGHPVQMRVLQLGDQVSIGRCLLIFGSREDISARIAADVQDDSGSFESAPSDHTIAGPSGFFGPNFDLPKEQFDSPGDDQDSRPDLFPQGPPEPPKSLRPAHRAEVSDILSYAHEQIRIVLQSGVDAEPEGSEESQMILAWIPWQRLQQLEMDLAVYLRKLAEPDN